jgi:putative peptidoglycan lipid II flippase
LTLVAGVLAGNVLGFGRVATTAYLLGTHSRADALAVAYGPIDTLNAVLMNSMVFAFVPLLTGLEGARRTALFLKLSRGFITVAAVIAALVVLTAPWLMKALAPGLDPNYTDSAVTMLRILALSSIAAGGAAVQAALLYTQRRFLPTAFHSAALNVGTIAGAFLLWKFVGLYAFAIGYTAGAWVQFAIVYWSARVALEPADGVECDVHWNELLAKPIFFMVYAAELGLNITFTRAYGTHAGPGMAAALDYCMRGVGVPLALLVNPITNSLLPEIARLKSAMRLRDAYRLINKTLALAALLATGGCAFALAFRTPAIRIFFEHGDFTADSTRLVAAVFLGLGPSVVGWGLMEIGARSMFALDMRWPPVIAALTPLILNVAITLKMHSLRPELLGVGASVGLLAGFGVLLVAEKLRGGEQRRAEAEL